MLSWHYEVLRFNVILIIKIDVRGNKRSVRKFLWWQCRKDLTKLELLIRLFGCQQWNITVTQFKGCAYFNNILNVRKSKYPLKLTVALLYYYFPHNVNDFKVIRYWIRWKVNISLQNLKLIYFICYFLKLYIGIMSSLVAELLNIT